MKHVGEYFTKLSGTLGEGWTRFWFTPGDPIVLCAIRVLTGLVAVYLHATLFVDLVPLFGPQGLLPVAEISPIEAGTFSYLNYLVTPAELFSVHALGLIVLLAFTVGFQTRIAAVLALVVFLSDVHRAPMITGRTEPLVAIVMCYLCLAPCGRYFSLDRRLRGQRAIENLLTPESGELFTSATIATRLLQIHFALWIAMMGLSKLMGDAWWSGLGVWWLISREQSRLVDFSWLYKTPKVLDIWTHLIVFFELVFPVLIWVPLARPLLLAAGVLVWTSLALVTGDFTFTFMLCIASLAFVSPVLVRDLLPRTAAQPVAV